MQSGLDPELWRGVQSPPRPAGPPQEQTPSRSQWELYLIWLRCSSALHPSLCHLLVGCEPCFWDMIGLKGVLDQDLPRGRFAITPHPAPWQPRAAPRQVPAPGVSASGRTRAGSGSLQRVTGLAQSQIAVHTLPARRVPRQLSPRSAARCSSSVTALLQPHHSEGGCEHFSPGACSYLGRARACTAQTLPSSANCKNISDSQ